MNYTQRVWSELDECYATDALVDMEGKVYFYNNGKLSLPEDQHNYMLERFTGLYDLDSYPIFERDVVALDPDNPYVIKTGQQEWEVLFMAPRFYLACPMEEDGRMFTLPLEALIAEVGEETDISETYKLQAKFTGTRGCLTIQDI